MTTVVPRAVSETLGHDPSVMQPPLHGPSREALDLALLAIGDMDKLSPTDRVREEEEVLALLDEIEIDQRRREELDGWLQRAAGTGEMRYQVLARLMGVPSTTEQVEEISGVEIAQRLETQGYVKQAPRFADQLEDESREGVSFQFDDQTFRNSPEDRGRVKYRTTELRGIRALSGFLGDFIRKSARYTSEAGFGAMRKAAKSMKENLTYIGGKEFDEGISGLGQYWAEYLQRDQATQVCVVTNSSLAGRQRGSRSMGMSDVYIRDKILEGMTKAEVSAQIMDRIITDPRKIAANPNKVKIVFVDDWVVSGRQMRKKIATALPLISSRYHGAIEVNVLTAPPHFIEEGLDVNNKPLPVKAYHRAHRAPAEASEGVGCHITGTHATNNFGVSLEIEEMTKLSNQIRGQGQPLARMPAVASIYRSYWIN